MKELKKQLFDNFDLHYFDAGSTEKFQYLRENIDKDAFLKGRAEIMKLICECELSNVSQALVVGVYSKIPSFWFLLPTSTTGKYHGGVLSVENSIGGNIIHVRNVLGKMGKVLHRYRELVNGTGNEYLEYKELLTVSCLLHDVGKASGETPVYCPNEHGELGGALVLNVWKELELDEPFRGYIDDIVFAISEHMHMWKAINVFDMFRVGTVNRGLILSSMLCECDYYS